MAIASETSKKNHFMFLI